MADEQRLLRVERNEGIATVIIDRPDKLNALNAAVIAELDATFRALAADAGVGGVILTGAGEKAFVAGADIGELSQMGPLDGVQVSRRGQELLRFVERMPKPVIAAVNGFALGGGLETALACHMRIASENARFGLPEVKLGIIPGYGGTVRLPRLVGKGRALEIMLSGEMIGAEEAYRIGLVKRVVPQAELRSTTEQLLRRILANGPVAVALAIEAVDRGFDTTADEALAFEAKLFGLLAATDDMREGMRAFLEKRPAAFRGQ
jgi:enoyl-CoA hydratase